MKLTNQSGVTVWSATYDAFGKATIDPSSTVTNNLRFPGQYYDAESNLHNNWMRYYDAGGGRYLTSDPTGLHGGVNMYAYAEANPVAFADPKGQWILGTLAAVGAIGYFLFEDVYPAYKKDNPADMCECKEALEKANRYYAQLHAKFPDVYKKNLSIGVSNIEGKGGVTYVSNGDKIFIGKQYFCANAETKFSDADLKELVAHEGIHANESWFMRTPVFLGDEYTPGSHHHAVADWGRYFGGEIED